MAQRISSFLLLFIAMVLCVAHANAMTKNGFKRSYHPPEQHSTLVSGFGFGKPEEHIYNIGVLTTEVMQEKTYENFFASLFNTHGSIKRLLHVDLYTCSVPANCIYVGRILPTAEYAGWFGSINADFPDVWQGDDWFFSLKYNRPVDKNMQPTSFPSGSFNRAVKQHWQISSLSKTIKPINAIAHKNTQKQQRYHPSIGSFSMCTHDPSQPNKRDPNIYHHPPNGETYIIHTIKNAPQNLTKLCNRLSSETKKISKRLLKAAKLQEPQRSLQPYVFICKDTDRKEPKSTLCLETDKQFNCMCVLTLDKKTHTPTPIEEPFLYKK